MALEPLEIQLHWQQCLSYDVISRLDRMRRMSPADTRVVRIVFQYALR